MALPFAASGIAFLAYSQMCPLSSTRSEASDKGTASRQPQNVNPNPEAAKSPKSLKRSESEYSLGLSRNRSVNADLNEVGNVCSTGEALYLSLKITAGIVLAAIMFGKYAVKK
jgi:hypothetical protein